MKNDGIRYATVRIEKNRIGGNPARERTKRQVTTKRDS